MDLWKRIVQLGQKVLGKDFENPLNLDKELLNAFGAYVEPVSEVDPDLAIALLRYLIDDADETCLLTLSGNDKANSKLTYYTQYNAPDRRSEVVDASHKAPPEVWFRYGKVLSAVQKGVNPNAYYLNGVKNVIPVWIHLLLTEISTRYTENLRRNNRKAPWNIDDLEQIAVTSGLAADALVEPFINSAYKYSLRGAHYYAQSHCFLSAFGDVGKYLLRHAQTLRAYLLNASADERIHVMETLREIDFDFSVIEDLIVKYATGTSRSPREAALKVFLTKPEKYRPIVESALKEGAASERNEAVTLLWRMFASDCADTLREHAATEKAERVKQTIEKFLATPTDHSAVAIELPPLQLELDPVPLPDDLKKGIRDLLTEIQEAANEFYDQQMQIWNGPARPRWSTQPVKPANLSKEDIEKVIAFVEGSEPNCTIPDSIVRFHMINLKTVSDLLVPPNVKLAHVVRLMHVFKTIQVHSYGSQSKRLWMSNGAILYKFREESNASFGLREFDAVTATLPGYEKGMVAMTYLGANEWSNFCEWEPEAIWPMFAERADLVHECLIPSSGNQWAHGNRSTAFKVLAMFPTLPPNFIPVLWELALSEAKTERRPAQDALNTVPGKVEKIIVALGDGKQGVRSAAAEWLGRLGDSVAIEPLKKAFNKEKNEQAKGIIVHALDLLNADVNEFLNRDNLLAEAKSGLSKKLPKGMEWVDLDNLPTLHWKDTGKTVDPDIVKWWVVQSIQQKSPVCGPILKRYLEMCNPVDTAKFAKHVLMAWIGRDSATISHEEAVAKATVEADKQWNAYSQQQWFIDSYKTKDNVFKMHYNSLMNTCLYSAIDQKGMLAIVSAAGDGDCVKLSEQYIRKFYGQRVAQCKALVDVLAWISHPLALQTLLAIANRFRTKSIKELAAAHVNAVAERRGWTLDELADRTIPDGGFELPLGEDDKPTGEKAILEIDFGPRQFVVSLNDQLEPVICAKGETKVLKALPAPAKSDDEELAKAGKKEFADAKKITKEVVKRQTERLYEALCTQREWKFEDWQLYLANHPIVGRLCVRLAWVVFERSEIEGEQGKFLGAFRPLEDGSLTNEKDEQVTFPKDAIVKVAHSCNMPDELAAAWKQHFEDYDVTPLFPQLGRPVYTVPQDKLKATDITDFVGYLIMTFKLRNKAVKLGYVRGDAEDGGCFYSYSKTFSSLEMQAVLEFTGSYLPETDMPAALKELYFVSTRGGSHSWSIEKIPLSKVPAVLLSECYNDVQQIAAEGSGYDPKWQEKSYF